MHLYQVVELAHGTSSRDPGGPGWTLVAQTRKSYLLDYLYGQQESRDKPALGTSSPKKKKQESKVCPQGAARVHAAGSRSPRLAHKGQQESKVCAVAGPAAHARGQLTAILLAGR